MTCEESTEEGSNSQLSPLIRGQVIKQLICIERATLIPPPPHWRHHNKLNQLNLIENKLFGRRKHYTAQLRVGGFTQQEDINILVRCLPLKQLWSNYSRIIVNLIVMRVSSIRFNRPRSLLSVALLVFDNPFPANGFTRSSMQRNSGCGSMSFNELCISIQDGCRTRPANQPGKYATPPLMASYPTASKRINCKSIGFNCRGHDADDF